MIKIYQAANGVEAQLILNLFDQANISGRIDGKLLQGGVGELQPSGFVTIWVKEEDKKNAKEILRQWDAKETINFDFLSDNQNLTDKKPLNAIKVGDHTIQPSKVVCIGRNYVGHIKELNNEAPTEPVIFMKPNSAISNEIAINGTEEIHYEGEISFVVYEGQLSAVGFGLDLTKRQIQTQLKTKGLPWERAKSFDGSAVLSEFVDFDGDTEKLTMELWINGELIQSGGTELMLYKPKEILTEINSFSSLVDGDVIMTGTPEGVGIVHKNAEFIGKIFQNDQLLIEKKWTVKT